MRYGMVINKQLCVGCQACTIACLHKHGNPPNIYYSKVQISEEGTFPNVDLDFQPTLCNHCSRPPCVDICPTNATYRNEEGIVVMVDEECIGCSSCVLVCPYSSRVSKVTPTEMYAGQGLTPYEELTHPKQIENIVGKCDFCIDLLAKGLQPACVRTCVGGARTFGDLDDPQSEVSKLIAASDAYVLQPEQDTDPSVYYIAR